MATADRPASTDLQGVVVGGGGAIGQAIVRARLASAGRVVVADRALPPARRSSGSPLGDGTMEVICDICDLAEVEALVDKCADWCDRIDYVIVAAGITQWGGIMDPTAAKWRDVIGSNLLGPAHILKSFAPALIASSGTAVIVSSLSGREVYAGQPIYTATRWGAIGLAHSVRRELQNQGVRVSVVAPGLVDTPMSRGNPVAAGILKTVTPLSPDDVAGAVEFILSQPRHVLVREIQLQPVDQAI